MLHAKVSNFMTAQCPIEPSLLLEVKKFPNENNSTNNKNLSKVSNIYGSPISHLTSLLLVWKNLLKFCKQKLFMTFLQTNLALITSIGKKNLLTILLDLALTHEFLLCRYTDTNVYNTECKISRNVPLRRPNPADVLPTTNTRNP